MAVNNGRDAIDRLLDFAPDIVLADVFMPSPNGYEVCEYVKTNEKLKHIPVVLLVGSFEPFDEAEARRVGADDILTKPFSSIRRLIDRVGALVSSPPPVDKTREREGPTAELLRTEEPAAEPRLSTEELEVTTADTMPLPEEMLIDSLPRVEQPMAGESSAGVSPSARLESLLQTKSSQHEGTSEHEGRMESGITETKSDSQTEPADVLLDLGDIAPAHAADSDEFVLDLDLDETPVDELVTVDEPVSPYAAAYTATESTYESAKSVYEAAPVRPFVEPEVTEAPYRVTEAAYAVEEAPYAAVHDSTEIEPYEAATVPPELTPDPVPVFGETEFPTADTPHVATSISGDQLSPEMIDAIARRCVELMSDKVIREIAWEVVPDLAELLIKRQLEEKAK